eukprot:CAMPEP_0113643108 /NCGR_PEP_ID=MMETSP0017_2-20120614/22658_1 /TAXON_ID=2856 /ORGANISM="Cylindrotheca closterium" /LENGTH=391 /DNA_ID=CAMNT_0000554589 /DNA_START=272 /DNA_END=1447 /DNA_ORIENTATION=- /assembly_acc=CAM_ASM_000147
MSTTSNDDSESVSRADPRQQSQSPSMFSPVGDPTRYSVAVDEDDGHEEEDFIHFPTSPVQHVLADQDLHDSSWQNFDDDLAEPPRLRLESDMNAPLLQNGNQRRATPLNGLNYLNFITYCANCFVSFNVGVRGMGSQLPKSVDVFLEVQTLITPARWAYILWAPILVFEAIFAIAQLLPNYRARPIIQQGTGYFFFWTCLVQTVWTLAFAFEKFIVSFVAVLCALISMACLLTSQHYYRVRGRKSLVEYWLFRFPFYLHCGWLILSSVVQFSILFRYLTSNVGVQLAADVVALGAMLPAATFFLTGQPSGPDFVIPLVIIWSYIGIALPLHNPSDTLLATYDHSDIVAVRDSAYFFACTVGLMLIPRVVIWVFQEFCTINVVELDDASTGV